MSRLNKPYNFIEVCSGAGGLSLGLIQTGMKPILLNDNDNDCYNTLKINHPNTHIILGNMEDIDFSCCVNKIDLLCGGVPCQSFSQAGKRKGLTYKRGQLMLKI
jgi:DNA (cytosine-5)-methyltransferase 1